MKRDQNNYGRFFLVLKLSVKFGRFDFLDYRPDDPADYSPV